MSNKSCCEFKSFSLVFDNNWVCQHFYLLPFLVILFASLYQTLFDERKPRKPAFVIESNRKKTYQNQTVFSHLKQKVITKFQHFFHQTTTCSSSIKKEEESTTSANWSQFLYLYMDIATIIIGTSSKYWQSKYKLFSYFWGLFLSAHVHACCLFDTCVSISYKTLQIYTIEYERWGMSFLCSSFIHNLPFVHSIVWQKFTNWRVMQILFERIKLKIGRIKEIVVVI